MLNSSIKNIQLRVEIIVKLNYINTEINILNKKCRISISCDKEVKRYE